MGQEEDPDFVWNTEEVEPTCHNDKPSSVVQTTHFLFIREEGLRVALPHALVTCAAGSHSRFKYKGHDSIIKMGALFCAQMKEDDPDFMWNTKEVEPTRRNDKPSFVVQTTHFLIVREEVVGVVGQEEDTNFMWNTEDVEPTRRNDKPSSVFRPPTSSLYARKVRSKMWSGDISWDAFDPKLATVSRRW
ncbi:hypothetical protein ACLOJK_036988 [Asimina triloba]